MNKHPRVTVDGRPLDGLLAIQAGKELRETMQKDAPTVRRHGRSKDTYNKPVSMANVNSEAAQRIVIVLRQYPDGLTYADLQRRAGTSMKGSALRFLLGKRGLNLPRRRIGFRGHFVVWPSVDDMNRILRRKGIVQQPELFSRDQYVILHRGLFSMPGAPLKEWNAVLAWQARIQQELVNLSGGMGGGQLRDGYARGTGARPQPGHAKEA